MKFISNICNTTAIFFFFLAISFVPLMTGCDCKQGDFNYSIPSFIPNNNGQTITVKQEINTWILATSFGPTQYNPGTLIYLYPFSKNEFFSVTRFDPYQIRTVVIYWQSDYIPFSDNNSIPIYKALKPGEEITIHNCVFLNTRNPGCFFRRKPKTRTALSVTIKVVRGEIVEKNVDKGEDDDSSFKTYGYYLSSLKARIKSGGDYIFEVVANADSTNGEDFTDNKYVTRQSL